MPIAELVVNARVAVPPDGEERPTAMTSAITVLASYMGLKNEDTVGYLCIQCRVEPT